MLKSFVKRVFIQRLFILSCTITIETSTFFTGWHDYLPFLNLVSFVPTLLANIPLITLISGADRCPYPVCRPKRLDTKPIPTTIKGVYAYYTNLPLEKQGGK